MISSFQAPAFECSYPPAEEMSLNMVSHVCVAKIWSWEVGIGGFESWDWDWDWKAIDLAA